MVMMRTLELALLDHVLTKMIIFMIVKAVVHLQNLVFVEVIYVMMFVMDVILMNSNAISVVPKILGVIILKKSKVMEKMQRKYVHQKNA